MDFSNKCCFLTGSSGFIGYKLGNKLESLGANVIRYTDDVRDFEKLNQALNHSVDYIFHFGCPSSQVQFKQNISYCIDTTVNSFMHLVQLSVKYNAKLIYPSTGLLDQDKYNEYARCKKTLEDIHLGCNVNALGLRIYACYGENENHKREYASPVYLFCRDIVNRKSPVVWGDGLQNRDFIYIDDLVDYIAILAEDCNEKIIGIGTGTSHTFTEIIEIANHTTGHNIAPIHIDLPSAYYRETLCNTTALYKYCHLPRFTFQEGVRQVCEKLLSQRR